MHFANGTNFGAFNGPAGFHPNANPYTQQYGFPPNANMYGPGFGYNHFAAAPGMPPNAYGGTTFTNPPPAPAPVPSNPPPAAAPPRPAAARVDPVDESDPFKKMLLVHHGLSNNPELLFPKYNQVNAKKVQELVEKYEADLADGTISFGDGSVYNYQYFGYSADQHLEALQTVHANWEKAWSEEHVNEDGLPTEEFRSTLEERESHRTTILNLLWNKVFIENKDIGSSDLEGIPDGDRFLETAREYVKTTTDKTPDELVQFVLKLSKKFTISEIIERGITGFDIWELANAAAAVVEGRFEADNMSISSFSSLLDSI